jgi:hypothetical protein
VGCRGLWRWHTQSLHAFCPRREHTDPFALQDATGHDNIKTTMRYVHPRANAVHTLLARLAALGSGKLLSNGNGDK